MTCDNLRVISIASRTRLRLASLFGLIFVDFESQNGCQNLIFAIFFSMFFWIVFLHRFLLEFWKLETRKIAVLIRKTIFAKSVCLKKVPTNVEFWLHIWIPKWKKFANFNRFFLFLFFRFCLHLGFQKSIKNHSFSKNFEVRQRPLKHNCFGAAFWMDFEALSHRF